MNTSEIATKNDIKSLAIMIDELKSSLKTNKTVSFKKQVYSLKEACVVLGISEGTFRKMESMGVIQGGAYLPDEYMGKRLYKASLIQKLVDNLPG